jgi:hypothetical protein
MIVEAEVQASPSSNSTGLLSPTPHSVNLVSPDTSDVEPEVTIASWFKKPVKDAPKASTIFWIVLTRTD